MFFFNCKPIYWRALTEGNIFFLQFYSKDKRLFANWTKKTRKFNGNFGCNVTNTIRNLCIIFNEHLDPEKSSTEPHQKFHSHVHQSFVGNLILWCLLGRERILLQVFVDLKQIKDIRKVYCLGNSPLMTSQVFQGFSTSFLTLSL